MLPKKTWSFLPLVTQTLTVMIMYKNSESTMTKKRALISKQSTRQNSVIALLHDLTTEKNSNQRIERNLSNSFVHFFTIQEVAADNINGTKFKNNLSQSKRIQKNLDKSPNGDIILLER